MIYNPALVTCNVISTFLIPFQINVIYCSDDPKYLMIQHLLRSIDDELKGLGCSSSSLESMNIELYIFHNGGCIGTDHPTASFRIGAKV